MRTSLNEQFNYSLGSHGKNRDIHTKFRNLLSETQSGFELEQDKLAKKGVLSFRRNKDPINSIRLKTSVMLHRANLDQEKHHI
jgi:hypothetical protein